MFGGSSFPDGFAAEGAGVVDLLALLELKERDLCLSAWAAIVKSCSHGSLMCGSGGGYLNVDAVVFSSTFWSARIVSKDGMSWS